MHGGSQQPCNDHNTCSLILAISLPVSERWAG